MKTKQKRKSLGEIAWESVDDSGKIWDDVYSDEKREWNRAAQAVRREVIKREMERAMAEDGKLQLHGSTIERDVPPLEDSERFKAKLPDWSNNEVAASAVILGEVVWRKDKV